MYWNSVIIGSSAQQRFFESGTASSLSARKFIILLLLRICYHEISLRLGMLNCFDYKSLSGTRRSGKARLEKFRRSANRLRHSRSRLFAAIPPRIILSQFNQPVIKELGLTLQLYFCISTVRADSPPFFLLGRSKLNFLCLSDAQVSRAREEDGGGRPRS